MTQRGENPTTGIQAMRAQRAPGGVETLRANPVDRLKARDDTERKRGNERKTGKRDLLTLKQRTRREARHRVALPERSPRKARSSLSLESAAEAIVSILDPRHWALAALAVKNVFGILSASASTRRRREARCCGESKPLPARVRA
jgi:hypothetical protein